MNIKQEEKANDKIMGAEGCGIIEDCGPGVDKSLKGKKVAFCYGGWSQYTIKDLDQILIFDEKVELRDLSQVYINPLTVLCLRKMVLDRNLNSVIFLGASSSLGKLFINLCKDKGIECIPLVRNQESLQMMKEEFKMNMALNLEE